MAVLIVIVLIVALAAFGFFWHVLWLGVLVGVLALFAQLAMIGLDANRPAGRLNIGVVSSVGRFLVEVTDRARHRPRHVEVVDVKVTNPVTEANPTAGATRTEPERVRPKRIRQARIRQGRTAR